MQRERYDLISIGWARSSGSPLDFGATV